MKIKIKKREELYVWGISGKTITEIIEILSELAKDYGNEAEIDITTSGYDSPELYISYEREETDEEYEKRVLKEQIEAARKVEEIKERQKKIAKKREKDLKELARLKAIYEK